MKKFSCVSIAVLIFTVVFTGCTGLGRSGSDRYSISYCSADNEPVYIERVKYDQYNVMPGGILMGGWQIAGGSIELFPPPPVPKQIYIYWFSYRQQVFYEATVPLKENADKIMYDLPKPRFGGPLLVTGVLPDGTAVVWVANGSNAKFSTWIEVGRTIGHLVDGDVENFRSQTEEMRRREEI